jgi:hypothetical protein
MFACKSVRPRITPNANTRYRRAKTRPRRLLPRQHPIPEESRPAYAAQRQEHRANHRLLKKRTEGSVVKAIDAAKQGFQLRCAQTPTCHPLTSTILAVNFRLAASRAVSAAWRSRMAQPTTTVRQIA